MRFEKIIPGLALLFIPSATLRGQTAEWSETFDDGIPDTFTLKNYDGMGVQSDLFRNIVPQKTWFAAKGLGGRSSQAAVSCSRRQKEKPTNNWLITPQIDLTDESPRLSWDAHSLHRKYSESYQVMISTTGTARSDFKPLFETDAESYRWQHHSVSLSQWQGEKVYIAFVHNTTNGFLLAIDNLIVGQPSSPYFTCQDLTLHSCGNTGTTPICGTFCNTGLPVSLSAIRCTAGDGSELTQNMAGTAENGEEHSFSFNLPVTPGTATHYKVEAIGTDGTAYALAEGSVFCTEYPRTLMMEKVTAYWCNNCPALDPFIYDLEDRLGDQFVEVSVQYPSNMGSDPGNLICDTFYKGLSTPNLPTIYYDRLTQDPQYSYRETAPLLSAQTRPCTALVTLTSASLTDNHITVRLTSEFAADQDNSRDKFRIGLTLAEKRATTAIYQENNCTLEQYNEYYYLPYRITQPMAVFANVVRGTDVAFAGISQSYPEKIEARKSYPLEYTFDLPDGVSNPDADNLFVVAYALNTFSGEVLNAAKIDVHTATPEGIAQAPAADGTARPACVLDGKQITATFPQGVKGMVALYSADGKLLLQLVEEKSKHVLPVSTLAPGCYFVKMTSPSGSFTEKIALK